jgi:toxin YoeB
MALNVIWTFTARDERREILRFYRERNGNSKYSKELARRFDAYMALVAEEELLGKRTDMGNVRCLFVLDYSLFYTIKNEQVIVLSLWDNRRDPEDRPY